GGLTKTGAGTLVLSGANTYRGTTTVSGGTLTVNNNGSDTFSDTTTIQISSGAVLNLPNDVTDIVGTLVLGGQTYTSGVFDSSNSGGLIAGSGKIQVGATVVAGYSTWASQNAPTGTATDDYDNDGVANGLEYVLGGSKDTQDANKKPQCSVSGGVMTFTFVRDQASIDGTTQVAIEVGTNLGTWPSVYAVGTDTAGSSAGVSVTKDSPATGKDTVSLSVSGSDSKKFARLRVITN
ncbi:MAG: hypothetical protein EBZ05_10320, partial [Verrucomicrobia bacterium]|nr:hypothetical protein [Verrucomicrobiota bacterium]